MTVEKKKSLSDVASAAGVSIATASRVLSGSPLPAQPTREKVRLAAETIGYIPDPRFRLMGQQRNGVGPANVNIGMILRSNTGDRMMTDPYYGRMFFSVEEEARKEKRHVSVVKLAGEGDEYLPHLIADMFVGGAIVANMWDVKMIERISKIMPAVLLNSAPEGVRASSVMPDEASGITQAMDYLRELGHRKIFFFMVDNAAYEARSNWHHRVRERTFLNYVARHKEDVSEARLEKLLWDGKKSEREMACDVLTRWQKEGDLPTALICATDAYAFAFMDEAHSLDIKIPGRMSLIGADDTVPCEFVRPRLTSIRQPLELMGKEAVKILLHEMTAGETPIVKQLFDVELVCRKSCAPPPAT